MEIKKKSLFTLLEKLTLTIDYSNCVIFSVLFFFIKGMFSAKVEDPSADPLHGLDSGIQSPTSSGLGEVMYIPIMLFFIFDIS